MTTPYRSQKVCSDDHAIKNNTIQMPIRPRIEKIECVRITGISCLCFYSYFWQSDSFSKWHEFVIAMVCTRTQTEVRTLHTEHVIFDLEHERLTDRAELIVSVSTLLTQSQGRDSRNVVPTSQASYIWEKLLCVLIDVLLSMEPWGCGQKNL